MFELFVVVAACIGVGVLGGAGRHRRRRHLLAAPQCRYVCSRVDGDDSRSVNTVTEAIRVNETEHLRPEDSLFQLALAVIGVLAGPAAAKLVPAAEQRVEKVTWVGLGTVLGIVAIGELLGLLDGLVRRIRHVVLPGHGQQVIDANVVADFAAFQPN